MLALLSPKTPVWGRTEDKNYLLMAKEINTYLKKSSGSGNYTSSQIRGMICVFCFSYLSKYSRKDWRRTAHWKSPD
jgi:hypothetical protein